MPTFSKAIDVYNYFFQDSLQDKEGELFILLALLQYTDGYFKKWRKSLWLWWLFGNKESLITFWRLTPPWWSLQKTYIYLFGLFRVLEIQPDFIFHKKEYLKYNRECEYDLNNPLFDRFYNKNETKLLFEEWYFWQMDDDILEFIEIKNNFDTTENIQNISRLIDQHIDAFMSDEISTTYQLISHRKQRNLIINKLSDFYSLVWSRFTIQQKQFIRYEKFSLLYMVVLLWRLWYIGINSFHGLDDMPEFDEEWKYKHEKDNLNFEISVRSKAMVLFEGLFSMKNLILDKIFDEEYKQLKIIKKWGALHMLEWEMEIMWDAMKFTELRKKYPHSEITATNYDGKTQKITVKEKIKLIKS